MPPFSARTSVLLASAFSLTTLLTGCGAGSFTAATPSAAGISLGGHVLGGQQPVTGAAISLYAVGTTTGQAATSLLTVPVLTNLSGNFTITGDYTCPSASAQVYIVSRGGNPGMPGVVNNAAEVMMAPLGDCGNLQPSTFITINELTTVASAWSLAQFAGTNASFSASATNSTGIRNSMLVANNLVNVATGAPGGATLPAGAVLESTKMNTLADALAVCINSNGGAACTPLFTAATVNGTAPANTLDAALNIVRHPAQNVAAVFNTVPAQPPFQPTLTAAPNDWTMTLTYNGGGLSSPTTVGTDSQGNVWSANYNCCAVTKLSPTGVPAAAGGFIDPRLNESYGLAIDGQDSAWVTVEESTGGVNGGVGSVSKFSSSGTLLSGNGFYGGGVYYPYAIAADTDGSIWVPDYGRSRVTILANDGSAITPSAGFQPAGFAFPLNVAMDGQHNGWFATQGTASKVSASGTGSVYSCCRGPSGVALDPAGNVWVADYPSSALVQLTPSGAVAQQLTSIGGLKNPENVTADGAGQIWAGNYLGHTISGFSSATAGTSVPLSPSTGFGVDASLGQIFSVAIDASGNLWASDHTNSTLVEFVGLAAPRKSPLLGLPVAP